MLANQLDDARLVFCKFLVSPRRPMRWPMTALTASIDHGGKNGGDDPGTMLVLFRI